MTNQRVLEWVGLNRDEMASGSSSLVMVQHNTDIIMLAPEHVGMLAAMVASHDDVQDGMMDNALAAMKLEGIRTRDGIVTVVQDNGTEGPQYRGDKIRNLEEGKEYSYEKVRKSAANAVRHHQREHGLHDRAGRRR